MNQRLAWNASLTLPVRPSRLCARLADMPPRSCESPTGMRHLLLLLGLGIPVQAVAHSPYYSQTERIEVFEGKPAEIKLLHGDGIIAGDPVRAIIVDGESHLLAISPLATSLHISCVLQYRVRYCLAYDDISAVVYEPDLATLERGRIIEEDEKPVRDAYPEDMGESFGFKMRSATLMEIIRFEGDKIIAYPLVAASSLIWWTLTALLLAPQIWRLYPTKGIRRKWSASTIAADLLRLLCFAGLMFVAIFTWAWEPYSIYYAGFFATLGLLAALFLTRPKRELASRPLES